MGFDTALSGLRAANTDLEVTGNNIANASTNGFKRSRAEFGSVYANSLLGVGANTAGSGVLVNDIAQQFTQGNITFTDNNLDLALNGGGFFIVEGGDGRAYTRSGTFGLDSSGNIISNDGSNLLGFPVNAQGTVQLGSSFSPLQVQVSNVGGAQTTSVDLEVNLDSQQDSTLLRTRTALSAVPAVAAGGTNGILAGSLDINGNTVSWSDGDSARGVASLLSGAATGLNASATTTADITLNSGFPVTLAAGDLNINSVPITGTFADTQALADALSFISDFTATDLGGGTLQLVNSVGDDIEVDVSGNAASGLNVTVDNGAGSTQALVAGGATQLASVGGTIELVQDDSVFIANAVGTYIPTAQILAGNSVANTILANAFNAGDQDTYNAATSLTIFDSQGNSHIASYYFRRELGDFSFDAGTGLINGTQPTNDWSVFVEVDGQNVLGTQPSGDPNSIAITFEQDGTLSPSISPFVVTDWAPQGVSNVLGPDPSLTTVPLPEPATSSNFVVDFTQSTLFGGNFAVGSVDQNGFASGDLVGLEIAENGILFARFNNGEVQTLGQIALANFDNPQGLSPLGDTKWVETFVSGQPSINAPGSGSAGVITSGALEESNVDLSEELVNLILAQRNFQANAKTIETEDAITQTILNIR